MKQLYYAIQTILHGRGSNVTKLISLSLGLTIGILLFSQIAFELSYEKCYPDAERLALARELFIDSKSGKIVGDDGDNYDYTLFAPVAAALAENLPEQIESATCIYPDNAWNLYKEDKLLNNVKYLLADTCFFQTLGIPMLKGNVKDMAVPGSGYVSERFARKCFGDEDPIGKTLTLDKQIEVTIRGVYKEIPKNTIFYCDLVISIHNKDGYIAGYGWKGNDVFFSLLRLRNASDIEVVNKRIQGVIEKYASTDFYNFICEYSAIPLVNYHLESLDTVKRLVIYGFLGFAIFFVAIMNYMLIAIAAMSRRAKMVGVHKCSGASTGNVFGMFMMETGIIVLLSVVISLFIIINAQEVIEDLLSVTLPALFTWETLWVPALTILVLFVLTGVLPGRLFARIPVTQVFRRYTNAKKGWKRSLLFVQFTGVSFVLGLLLVTLLQYNHLMNRDMGIKVPGLVSANVSLQPEEAENIADNIRRQPMVESVARSTCNVIGEYWTRPLVSNSGERIGNLNWNSCTSDYTDVMGIKIIEGSPMKNPGDLLVNEEVVRLMKWSDGAVGKRLNNFSKAGTIVGVFRDVRNFTFLHEQSPIALLCVKDASNTFNVRLKQPYVENKKKLDEFVAKTYPNVSLQFQLVSNMLDTVYKDVYRFRNSVWITSGFILLIVIMGVIGYVNDETQRRSKEIAIRKVNGAEAIGILRLLIRDILNVSIPSVCIGTLIAYSTGRVWLEQFPEQINLNVLYFIGVALFVMFLVVACVVIRAWRIANENPVKSIKSE